VAKPDRRWDERRASARAKIAAMGVRATRKRPPSSWSGCRTNKRRRRRDLVRYPSTSEHRSASAPGTRQPADDGIARCPRGVAVARRTGCKTARHRSDAKFMRSNSAIAIASGTFLRNHGAPREHTRHRMAASGKKCSRTVGQTHRRRCRSPVVREPSAKIAVTVVVFSDCSSAAAMIALEADPLAADR
jgi:hypothetical protein